VAFNADHDAKSVELPSPPDKKGWVTIVNTALLPPNDFLEETHARRVMGKEIKMAPYSAILLKAKASTL
jgi:hypothetical protein